MPGTVLITGGAGFIGRHLARALLERGYKLRVVDNLIDQVHGGQSPADALDKEFGMQFQTGMPDDIRNQLKDNGYAVKSKRQYAPLWLENGRPMILPVEDTNTRCVTSPGVTPARARARSEAVRASPSACST